MRNGVDLVLSRKRMAVLLFIYRREERERERVGSSWVLVAQLFLSLQNNEGLCNNIRGFLFHFPGNIYFMGLRILGLNPKNM